MTQRPFVKPEYCPEAVHHSNEADTCDLNGEVCRREYGSACLYHEWLQERIELEGAFATVVGCRLGKSHIDVNGLVRSVIAVALERGWVSLPESAEETEHCRECLEGSDMPDCPLERAEMAACSRRRGLVKLPSRKATYAHLSAFVLSESMFGFHEEIGDREALEVYRDILKLSVELCCWLQGREGKR